MASPNQATSPIAAAPLLGSRSSGPLPEPGPIQPWHDQRLLLKGIDWSTYQKISEALTECHVQLTYDRGRLELMTKSSAHETWNRVLYRLVLVLVEELDLPIRSCGQMTCNRQDLERGLEPDDCFYVQNEPRVRGRNPIDLATDPPPDLAFEIDVSCDSQGRLPIYAAIGVPEVWRFDGQAVTILQRVETNYAVAARSSIFPFLSGADLVGFLQRWSQTDEQGLVRSFRQWVRQQAGS